MPYEEIEHLIFSFGKLTAVCNHVLVLSCLFLTHQFLILNNFGKGNFFHVNFAYFRQKALSHNKRANA